MERDALKSTLVPIILHFNSHAHVERDTWDNLPDTIDEHFNSHAHVERDRIFTYFTDIDFISTHTLTWSVTPPVQSLSATTSYFNSHAHVERDCRFFLCSLFLCHFNSHAHVERDGARKCC